MKNIEQSVDDVNEVNNISPTTENYTIVFHERLNNPEIQDQLVSTLKKHRETMGEYLKIRKEDENGHLVLKNEQELKDYTDEDSIKKELIDKINTVFASTEINFKENGGSYGGEGKVGSVAIFSRNSDNNEYHTAKQLSMIEAHEKGHGIRSFKAPSKEFLNEIKSCFDTTQVMNDLDTVRLWKVAAGETVLSDEEAAYQLVNYIFTPVEVMERMSQLKNYFGMKGSEKFTKEHLKYVKEHYINDVGMVAQIKPFLDAITPETEDNFLKVINSFGV